MSGNIFPRTFAIKPAVRQSVPLLIGIVGPSGSGKTFSALRLATGIQRVQPGPICVIDTEANRALFYADTFRFDHVPFGAPFSPLDYLAGIEACVAHGARTIVVDSMSHEHEGPGGVLEWAQKEAERMSERSAGRRPPEAYTMPSYAAPKAARRRMLNSIVQLNCNVIACFRAKEKLKLPDRNKGERDPVQLGWQPIAGDEIVYEMVTQFLLLPGSEGVPCFAPEHDAERSVVKRPEFFRSMLERPQQLCEDLGEKMARWAAGETVPRSDLLQRVERAATEAECSALAEEARTARSKLTKPEWAELQLAFKAAKERLVGAEQNPITEDGYRPDFE